MNDIPPPALPLIEPPPLPQAGDDKGKVWLNAIVAGLLVLLAVWMAVADFSHRGDLLFQSSSSYLMAALFLGMLYLVLIGVAALPKRMIIGANVLLLCRMAMGFPLNSWLGNTAAARLVTAAFLVLSLVYLWQSLRRTSCVSARPWVEGRHSILAGGSWVLFCVLSLPMLGLGYVSALHNLVGDYVRIGVGGVNLVERVFHKDGQRIHLVGMMHVGEGAYYEELAKRMHAPPADGGKRLVLTEGVSDRNRILPQKFASGKTYEEWANLLGLKSQKELGGEGPARERSEGWAALPMESQHPDIVWRNADADVSDLKESHQKLLVGILEVMGSGNMEDYFVSPLANTRGEEIEDLMKNGLIRSRNNVLMDRLQEMKTDHTEIFIPWGAAHLPDLETRLLGMGYQMENEVVRSVWQFWK
jgi:hypothetical protein